MAGARALFKPRFSLDGFQEYSSQLTRSHSLTKLLAQLPILYFLILVALNKFRAITMGLVHYWNFHHARQTFRRAARAESKLKMLQSSRALNESFLRFLDLCAAPNKKTCRRLRGTWKFNDAKCVPPRRMRDKIYKWESNFCTRERERERFLL